MRFNPEILSAVCVLLEDAAPECTAIGSRGVACCDCERKVIVAPSTYRKWLGGEIQPICTDCALNHASEKGFTMLPPDQETIREVEEHFRDRAH